jgi:adenylosuccinate lyase
MREQFFDHSTFLSPFSWRYGSDAMRQVWSLKHQRLLWRQVWLALAETQMEAGLVREDQIDDLRTNVQRIDLDRAAEIERDIRHDLMAELKAYAEQCPVGGGILHLGATSADIQDNADALRLRESLDLLRDSLRDLLQALTDRIDAWADMVTMGYTHLQPAEPTTVGYRLACYAHDLLIDWHELVRVQASIRGKGVKGAVGTGASYSELLHDTGWTVAQFDAAVMAKLGLEAFSIAIQTYPRKQDWLILNVLAGIASSLHKMAFDVRLLQIPVIGEWAEPFGTTQVGSSAMPFKRNPIQAEKLDGLARWVAGLPRQAWDNAACSLLERTLDDSAVRRLLLPSAFLCVDEMLSVSRNIVQHMAINQAAIERNLKAYGTFAAVERLLMELGKAGADRQLMHERMREHSLQAWKQVAAGGANPLPDMLSADEEITRYLPARAVRDALDASGHVGDAPTRARALADEIRQVIAL